MRVLMVSSFVHPHAGGVEQFVATIRAMLEESGDTVRLLACRRPGEDGSADAVVPTWFVGPSGWPLPVGGARTLWREVGCADAVVANVSVQALPALAVLAARGRRVPALYVVHGSGEALPMGSPAFRAVRRLFQLTLARAAIRRAVAVSVSEAGVRGAERAFGVRARLLPYPLPELPPARPVTGPGAGGELRLAWIGRLSPEKGPQLAVAAVDRLREQRPAVLDMYGDGRMRGELEALAASRPWLTLHGSRPWADVLAAQERAHAVLSSSVWDNVQVALLETLARGIPAVSTRVGDAPAYLPPPALDAFCVPPGDADALAAALEALADGYDRLRPEFAANGARLRERHGATADVLQRLIADARAAGA